MAKSASKKPTQAIIRAFNVGFGDCFLLTFVYASGNRHVLIDYGSTSAPVNAAKDHMMRIAKKIGELTDNKLHVVVATHRHKDHISGFATNAKGNGTGDVIASYKPDLVLQPWTEDPDIPEEASGPKAFAGSLHNMNGFSAGVAAFAGTLTEKRMEALGFSAREKQFLGFIGDNNVANLSAIKNLMGMGKKTRYLHAGMDAGLKALLPGVTVNVLGPPSIDQHEEVETQNPKNQEEYWHLAATNGNGMSRRAAPLFPKFVGKPPLHASWIAQRLARLQKETLMGMVRRMDKAMNNTSLILLFRAGGKSLLFPGDAQWENWQFALSKPEWVKLLKDVDLYKVGHHGSLNATPKSLWNLFGKKSAGKPKPGNLTSLMSTEHGVHGEKPETAVPRSTLVAELEEHSHHHSTEALPMDQDYVEIIFEL